jgi:hypothetical protein
MVPEVSNVTEPPPDVPFSIATPTPRTGTPPLEGERARQLRERQQDRVAADQAWALVDVDRRRGAQLISIIFSRTA